MPKTRRRSGSAALTRTICRRSPKKNAAKNRSACAFARTATARGKPYSTENAAVRVKRNPPDARKDMLRRRKCLGSTERKKPDGCRQEPGCGIRKDSHTETEADKGYFAVQDKARKKFRHVRVPEREQVSSVGIGKRHTPIMENTFSFILYQIFFPLSRPAEKSRSCAAADELPDGETHIR